MANTKTKPKHTEQGGRIIGNYNGYHPQKYGIVEEQKYELSDSMDDLTTILDMGIQALKVGNTAKYPETKEGLEELKAKTIGYFEYINEANSRNDVAQRVYPDIEGLCIYLRISRKTLLQYERDRGTEWKETIGQIKNVISACKKQLASSFKIPPILQIFDATNNFGYVNSNEFKLVAEPKPQNDRMTIDTEQLEQQIQESGLVWDEDKQEFVPIEGA